MTGRTKEDQRLLNVAGALEAERIVGVETGGCPNTARADSGPCVQTHLHSGSGLGVVVRFIERRGLLAT